MFCFLDSLKQRTELIYYKSQVASLEMRLQQKETELQELTINTERQISKLNLQHDVSRSTVLNFIAYLLATKPFL